MRSRRSWARPGALRERLRRPRERPGVRGQAGIARSVALYRALFPDLRIEVVDQVGQGDQVVSRWTLHGTHRGRRVTLPGITISRFQDGQIAEDWTVSDNLTLLRQLGLRRGLALAVRYATGRLPGA